MWSVHAKDLRLHVHHFLTRVFKFHCLFVETYKFDFRRPRVYKSKFQTRSGGGELITDCYGSTVFFSLIESL